MLNESPTTPMNLREAIEAAKIVAPIADDIIKASEVGGLDAALALIEGLERERPTDALRLLALLHHRTIDDVADELSAPGTGAMYFFESLTAGLLPNGLMDIIGFAKMLGMRQSYG